jgi:hypothetical protein
MTVGRPILWPQLAPRALSLVPALVKDAWAARCLGLLSGHKTGCTRSVLASHLAASREAGGSVFRFGSAFRQMRFARDHLEIRQAPVLEQPWPRFPAVLPPHAEERHPVVDLGHRWKALPGQGTAKPLNALQHRGLEMRRGPEFPRDRAGLVPSRPHARASVAPQVAVPSVAKDRLAADAAGTASSRECRFPKGRGRRSKVGRQSVPAVDVEGPGPSRGRSA